MGDKPQGAESATLSGYEVLVGVCGGIAAYKVAALVSSLVQRGAGVSVAMTDAAQRFVGPLTFEALTARQVFTSVWDAPDYSDQQHIRLTEAADLFIIAPATANSIGKIACGLADDLVSTLAMTADCPILLAPAMNARMWQNPMVRRNMQQLRDAGMHEVGPEEGWLACRTIGAGRMAEPAAILEAATRLLSATPPKAVRPRT